MFFQSGPRVEGTEKINFEKSPNMGKNLAKSKEKPCLIFLQPIFRLTPGTRKFDFVVPVPPLLFKNKSFMLDEIASEFFQNLSYFWNKKTPQKIFFRFSFRATLDVDDISCSK